MLDEAADSLERARDDIHFFAGCYRCAHCKGELCALHRTDIDNRFHGRYCEVWEWRGVQND